MSVIQQNSDLASDSTEYPDKSKKKRDKHRDKPKCAEGKQEGCSNPYQLHSLWWSCRWEVHRGWSQTLGSFVTRSTVPWNIAVPPDGIFGVRILADVSVAFHVEQEREVSWVYAGIFTLKFGRKKKIAQVLSLWWNKLEIRRG